MTRATGTLLLLGGGERADPRIAARLAELSAGSRAAVVPTAAAFSQPEREVIEAGAWLSTAGFEVEGLMAVSRADAELAELAGRLDDKDLAYLSDGTAMHLRTTLRQTPLLDHLTALLERGAVLAASGAAAMVLCDPMVDPRGGAPTVGLGLLRAFVAIGHDADDPHREKLHRSIVLVDPDLPVVALPERGGIICHGDGRYELLGDEPPAVYLAGAPAGLEVLEAWC